VINSGLSNQQAEFIYTTLHDVFKEIRIPKNNYIKGDKEADHPIVWMLIDSEGESLKKIYEICIDLSIVKQIPNYGDIFQRLKKPDSYIGARAELHVGAWIRTATDKVQFILPDQKKKTADFEVALKDRRILVEVKGSSETDFEVGLSMFEGWLRSRLIEFFPKDGQRRIVKVGGYWIDGIGAACNINPKIQNASWAFHSGIMSLVTQAAYYIGRAIAELHGDSLRVDPDIEILLGGEVQKDGLSVAIELTRANRIALIGNIIRKLTEVSTIQKFEDRYGIFCAYTQDRVDEVLANQLFGTVLRQCPELERCLMGVVIFDDETKNPIIIHISTLDDKAWDSESWELLHSCFKKPDYQL
jgi:hypothetical protein